MKYYRNIGHHERVVRVGIGFLLLALSGFSTLPGWENLIFMIVGLIALLTGIIGYCPAWQIMGINICPTKTSEHPHSHTERLTNSQAWDTRWRVLSNRELPHQLFKNRCHAFIPN